MAREESVPRKGAHRRLSRGLGGGLALAFLLLPLPASAAACMWFADATSIKQINTDDNSIVADVPLPAPRRLVMNDNDCSVWALSASDRRLIKFDAAGNEVRNVDLTQLDPALVATIRIRLDPFDNSLWVTDSRRISHFDAEATTLLASFTAPADIRRLRIGMDQKLWVLGKRKLWRFNRQGKLLEERLLDPVLQGEAKHFAVDELRGKIWIAGDFQIASLEVLGAGAANVVIQTPDPMTAFALDPITGRIWYARAASIEALNPDGSIFTGVPLGLFGLTDPNRLAFDPASRSLWAGFAQKLGRINDNGDLTAILNAADYDDEALGVPPFIVKPRVVLDRPPEGALINKRRPHIKLEYKARCNGRNCDVPDVFFLGLQLVSTLNGSVIGGQFVFDPITRTAGFDPTNPLPDGVSTFTARLTDAFGHKSNLIDTTFTLDTTPPQFGPITPADGSVLGSPFVTLQGTVNEPGSSVILGNALNLSPQGSNPQFPQAPAFGFSWGLTLLPGLNPLQLTVVDAAGNATSRAHSLTFTGTPQATIQLPANGATIADNTVTVTGQWFGPPNTGITVNGVIAATSGNQYFATLALLPGLNTITVTLTAPNGEQVIATTQVTSTGASATRVTADVLQGFAPLTVSFTVTSDRPIALVEGNVAVGMQKCVREGVIICFEAGEFRVSPVLEPFSFTYDQPGVWEARFNITHTDGTTATRTLRITVEGRDQLDQRLRQVWSGLTSALIRGDKAAAMQQLTGPAQQKYGPVFDDLLPDMPVILSGFSDLQLSTVDDGIGEYAVNRTIDGVNRLFFIYLQRGPDGVWRVDSM